MTKAKTTIFGYGSLLNRDSAARTLSNTALESYRPALAKGVKRLFNYHCQEAHSWGPVLHPKETAMLNIVSTQNEGDLINGALFEVDDRDLERLIEREIGYHLITISVSPWKTSSDQTNRAFAFCAKQEMTRSDILPVPNYAIAVLEGARSLGLDFLNFWLESTFLADQKTAYKSWRLNSK